MFVHLYYRELRKSHASRILVNLCAALLIALVVFILASKAGNQPEMCRMWAIALHYFFLCAIAWMVVQGINLYAVVVIVLGLQMDRRIKIYCAFGWGKFFLEVCVYVSVCVCYLCVCVICVCVCVSICVAVHARSYFEPAPPQGLTNAGLPAIVVAATIGVSGPTAYGASVDL
jgi:hypothetical protein